MAKAVNVKPQSSGPKLIEPDKPATYALAMSARWALADALMGGSEAMRDDADTYLPKHKNEDSDTYQARIQRSYLSPVFAHAVDNLTDTVFSNPLNWDKEASKELDLYLEEIDAEGNSIEQFAKQMFALAISKGEVYVFVDEPPLPMKEEGDTNVVTLADVRNAGNRPYAALISADNMLDYKEAKVGGRIYTTYARWKSYELRELEDDFGDYGVSIVNEWKLVDGKAIWKRFERIDGESEWTEASGELNIKYNNKPILPISRYRIGSIDSFNRLLPPLHGLAEKNVEHFQSASDQRAILTISRFPMLGGSGVDNQSLAKDDDDFVKVGPGVTMFAKSPDAEFYYIEPEGKAIEAGVTDLDRLEKEMSILAYQPLMRQQAGVTATKDALGQNKANSSLESWAIMLGIALDKAIEFFSIWLNRAAPVTNFKPNTEFGIDQIDAVRVAALDKMRDRGDLSRAQYLRQMSNEKVLDEDFDEEANDVELDDEGPDIITNPATGLPQEVPGLPNLPPAPPPAPKQPPAKKVA